VNHTHTNFELIFCLSGEAEAIINKRSYFLCAGKGVIVFPGQIHLYKNLKSGRFCVLVFKSELIPTLKDKFASIIPKSNEFDYENSAIINETLTKLCNEYVDNESYASLLCGYINILLHYVLPTLSFVDLSGEDRRLLDRIVEYCFAHFRESVTVSDIARALLTNSNRISAVFNKSMNMGIPQYVEFLRLSVACDLLKSTSKSVLEISEESGFGSVRSLNRAFSENLFTTPKDFRKHFAADYKIKLGGF
jgi:AraC-like DNA-binding protein